MGKNTSISLGKHFEEFIATEIESGRYNSASEVIRSALRLLEREENREKALLRALKDGEDSGMVDGFNPKEHLEELQRRHP